MSSCRRIKYTNPLKSEKKLKKKEENDFMFRIMLLPSGNNNIGQSLICLQELKSDA